MDGLGQATQHRDMKHLHTSYGRNMRFRQLCLPALTMLPCET